MPLLRPLHTCRFASVSFNRYVPNCETMKSLEAFSKLCFRKRPKKSVDDMSTDGEDGGPAPDATSALPSVSTSVSKIGPLVLFPPGNEDRNAKVDIVFVHGLRGDRIDAWSRSEVCWPRDLLKKDLPEARIITWGYDAKVANLFKSASNESIFGHAETLLSDLSRLRKEARQSSRPIIFIAHSLGGLVVKEALIKSDSYKNHGRHPLLAEIWPHTNAIIFCGTPHRGSGKEGLGEIVAAAATLALRHPNKQMLRTLKSDSNILESQRDNFTTISKDLDVVCLREELNTIIGLIVPESSASYDGFKVQRGSINANHIDMVKFSTTEDDGYKKIVRYIQEFVNMIEAEHREQDRRHEDEILDGLRIATRTKREDRIEIADDDTCSWILSDQCYRDRSDVPPSPLPQWLLSNEYLFWISGKAGSGKSTLMKYLHRVLKERNYLPNWSNGKPLLVAAFFFFEGGEELQKTREGMLRSLLHQILSRERSLIFKVFEEQRSSPLSTPFNWDTLQAAFEKVLTEYENSTNKLLLLIDGLDEYRMLDRMDDYTEQDQDFLYDGENDAAWGQSEWISAGHAEIAGLLNKFKCASNVKMIVSSRELVSFEDAFQIPWRVKVHEHTKPAISKFCQTRISLEDKAKIIDDIPYFVDKITTKSCGVFLWVRLVVDMLIQRCTKGDSPKELERILRSFPPRLGGKNGLYMQMTKSISQSDRLEASRLFRLVLNAEAPVDIFQLFFAAEGHIAENKLLALRDSLGSIKGLPEDKLKYEFELKQRRLKSRCAGLLEVAPIGSTVQFMHQTAKEFMSRQYLWDCIFAPETDTACFDVYLALLSGCIRLIKSNPPILRGWVRRGLRAASSDKVKGIFSDAHLAMADAISQDQDSYVRLVEELVKIYTSISDNLFTTEQYGDQDAHYFQHQHVPYNVTLLFSELDSLAPPPCDDFVTFAAHMGLATYLNKKLQSYSSSSVSAKANSLLSSAVGIWGPSRSPSMAVTARVVEVLLYHGASPNTTTNRALYTEGPGSRDIDRLTVPSSVWMDVLEAGYSTWGREPEKVFASWNFRFRHDDSPVWCLRTNFGSHDGYTYRVTADELREWIDIIKLLLQHGAKPNIKTKVRGSPLEKPARKHMRTAIPPTSRTMYSTKDELESFECIRTPIMMVRKVLLDHYPDDLAELECLFREAEQGMSLYPRHSQNAEQRSPLSYTFRNRKTATSSYKAKVDSTVIFIGTAGESFCVRHS